MCKQKGEHAYGCGEARCWAFLIELDNKQKNIRTT